MELKEIISLYRRWLWLLILGLVLGLGSGYLASKLQTPVYEASAKVLVTRSRQQGVTDILSISDQQLVLTYVQLLKTRPLLEEASSTLGYKIRSDQVTVEIISDTQIIHIKVQDKSRDRAAAIANALVQMLIDKNETLQAGRYAVYEEGLNTQITQVQKQSDLLQGQITQINQANIQEQLRLVNQQIADLQTEISSLESDVAKFPSLLSTVDRAKLVEKQTQLDQLRSLLRLYQEIQTNLTFIGRPVQSGSGSDDPRIASLQSTLNLYQQLYLNLLNNLTAVKLARAQSTPTVSPIENAVVPERPIRPIPLLYVAISGIVGLVIAAGAILLLNYFDDTLKSSPKTQEVLGIPILGEISETHSIHSIANGSAKPEISVPLLNAFGILRINVNRLLLQKSVKTILITSPASDDGKTTIAINLAAAFVQSGKKVALLDADLSNPALHSWFGLDNERGLSDLLAEDFDWQEVAHQMNGMTLITSGAQVQSSSVLLESARMTRLLDQLQSEVDAIIIDSPPLFSVDSQILASQVGGVLFVVRQGTTIASTARAMLSQLNLMGVNVLGTVLNRTPRVSRYPFYKYHSSNSAGKVSKKINSIETSHN